MSGRFIDLLAFATPRVPASPAARAGLQPMQIFCIARRSPALLIINSMHRFKSAGIAFSVARLIHFINNPQTAQAVSE
jgi:hypothetical protein